MCQLLAKGEGLFLLLLLLVGLLVQRLLGTPRMRVEAVAQQVAQHHQRLLVDRRLGVCEQLDQQLDATGLAYVCADQLGVVTVRALDELCQLARRSAPRRRLVCVETLDG